MKSATTQPGEKQRWSSSFIPPNPESPSPKVGAAQVADRWRGAAEVEVSPMEPAGDGWWRRARIIRAPFKYPLLRLEEVFAADDQGQPTRLMRQVAMVADHVLVKPVQGVLDQDFRARVQAMGGVVRQQQPLSGIWIIEFPYQGLDTVFTGMALMQQTQLVHIAEPDYLVHAAVTPNDPQFAQQWALSNTGQTGGTSGADISATAAWDTHPGSSNVVVAVIDSGIDYTHPDLAANIYSNPGEVAGNSTDNDHNGYANDVRGWDFVNNDADPQDDSTQGHGTHVAGIIGATGNNLTGVSGVCWQVKLLPVKCFDTQSNGTSSDLSEGLAYATLMKVAITNNSWQSYATSQTLQEIVDASCSAGILFVGAAGNDGTTIGSSFAPTPAFYRNPVQITVAATDQNDALASFSNRGTSMVDLAAPGVNILSTMPGGAYQQLSGTSMSTPMVTGACALLKSYRPLLTAQQVKQAVMQNVDALPALASMCASGGRLNVNKALLSVQRVDWSGGLDARGPPGGPFVNASSTLHIVNNSAASTGWSIASTASWLNLSATSGTLAPGTSTDVTLNVNSSASALPIGLQTGTLTLLDQRLNASQTMSVTLDVLATVAYRFPLDSDPGASWTRTGGWAFAQPIGGGGSSPLGYPDPVSGATGPNVFTDSPAGNYAGNINDDSLLTTQKIDLFGLINTRLHFKRWLNTDRPPFASASIAISTDPANPRQNIVWVETAAIHDSGWVDHYVDISALADHHPAIYITWIARNLNGADPQSGWNIDDIEILGQPIQGLKFDPVATLNEAGPATVQATLRLTPATTTATTLQFTSSVPSRVSVPASLSVPAGTSQVQVPLTVVNNALLDGSPSVTLAARSSGYLGVPVTVIVNDDETATLTLSLPSSARAGGPPATGSVAVSAAPAVDVQVPLVSSDPARLNVPAMVTIPAGQTSASFTVHFPRSTVLQADAVVQVSAAVGGWTGDVKPVTVLGDTSADMSIVLPELVSEGDSGVTGFVRLNRPAGSSPVIVTLTSSDPGVAVAGSVFIDSGSTTGTFTITPYSDYETQGRRTVTFTATANGMATTTASLRVADGNPASIGFTLTGPTQYASQPFAVQITALDINGEVASGFSNNFWLNADDGSTTTTPVVPYSFLMTQGVWRSPISIATPGAWRLTVQAWGMALSGASNIFNVVQPTAPVQVNLSNNDMVYDAFRGRLYVSTSSGTIIPINPVNGVQDAPIVVDPSYAGVMALSDDGSQLYVGVNGGYSVRRVPMATRVPAETFNMPGNTLVKQLLALPGRPMSVMVNQTVYDAGVARPVANPIFNDIRVIPGANSGSFYGVLSGYTASLQFFSLLADGLHLASSPASYSMPNAGGQSASDGKLLAIAGGTTTYVLDPNQVAVTGQIPVRATSAVPESNLARIYAVGSNGTSFQLWAYDTYQYNRVGVVDLPAFTGAPTGQLLRWGAHGLAFRTGTQILAVSTPLVPSWEGADLQVEQLATPEQAGTGQPLNYTVTVRNTSPNPAKNVTLSSLLNPSVVISGVSSSQGTPVVHGAQIDVALGTLAPGARCTVQISGTAASAGSFGNTATVTSSNDSNPANNSAYAAATVTPTTSSVRTIALTILDVVHDPVSDQLYALVGAKSATFANMVVAIDPSSAAVTPLFDAPGNPTHMRLTDDRQSLYISKGYTGMIEKWTLSSRSREAAWLCPNGSFSGLPTVTDLCPLGTDSKTLLVAYIGSNSPSQLIALQNGVLLAVDSSVLTGGVNALCPAGTPGHVYGVKGGTSPVYEFMVGGMGSLSVSVSSKSSDYSNGSAIKYANGRIYGSSGVVVDAVTGGVLKAGGTGHCSEPDPSNVRLYVQNAGGIAAFDSLTFAAKGSIGFGDGASAVSSSLVRWGTYGLAANGSNGKLYLTNSTASIVPDPPLVVQVPAQLAENAGVAVQAGAVTLLKPLPNDLTVTLLSSAPALVQVPASVVIPSGQLSASFDITVTNDSIVNGARTVTITAAESGAALTPISGTCVILDDEATSISLSLPDSFLEGSTGITGTVSLGSTAAVSLTVNLASSNATRLSVPATVTIPAGSSSTTFALTSTSNGKSDGNLAVNITASVPGWSAATGSVTVNDSGSTQLTLTSSYGVITEGTTTSGGSLFYVGLSGAAATDITVNVTSSDPSRLAVPTTVTISAGSYTGYIYLAAPENDVADGAASVSVTVSASGFLSATSSITVNDNDPSTLTLSSFSNQAAGPISYVNVAAARFDGYAASGMTGAPTFTAQGAGGTIAVVNQTPNAAWSGNNWSGSLLIAKADTGITVTATYRGISVTSNSFNLTVGPAAQLTFDPITSPQTSGTSFPATVRVTDASGNPVASTSAAASLSAYADAVTRTSGALNGSYGSGMVGTAKAKYRTNLIVPAQDIGTGGLLQGIELYGAFGSSFSLTNYTIRIRPTTLGSFQASPQFDNSTGWTTVRSGSFASANTTGWFFIPFNTPYFCDGSTSLIIEVMSDAAGTVSRTEVGAYQSGFMMMASGASTLPDPATWSSTVGPAPTLLSVRPAMRLVFGNLLSVSPATTAALTSGVWTGALTVNGGGTNVVIKASGALSGQSSPFDVKPSTVPAPVLNAPLPFLGGSSAPLSWSATQGASAYEVQWDHTSDFPAPQSSGWINATQITITGLADAQTTWFRVRAHWLSGGTEILGPWSNVISAVQDATPPAIIFGSPLAGYGGAVLRTIASSMTLNGFITDAHGISSFSVNGSPVSLGSGGAFTAAFSLAEGWNIMTLTAWDNASPPNQAAQTVSVLCIADTRSNGIPDDWEVANGLDGGGLRPMVAVCCCPMPLMRTRIHLLTPPSL
ncbi:S8 family serine peptidase [Prosthecobacter sp.]|uniref:S8 family serine peptidase n=1 Tax=Prosthecobacter sp. TaxID=1965333 RepID=UPI0025FE1C48|nr:S8 family serine peptidase [Prosthecobacter sp.]